MDKINPLSWFERLIRDFRNYKLEKARLKQEFAALEHEREIALRELEIKREVYLETLQEKRKIISTLNEPIMHQIKVHSNSIKSFQNQSQIILEKIISADISAEDMLVLCGIHKELNEQIQIVIKAMQTAVDSSGNKLLGALEKVDQNIPTAALRGRMK